MKRHARILVADDEPHIRRILQFLLEQEGFEVLLAATGDDAWATFREYRPNLLLLDTAISGIDGIKILEMIRESVFQVVHLLHEILFELSLVKPGL